MHTLDIIKKCAAIPSFSSYEERIHDTIDEICKNCKGIEIHKVHKNNLVLYMPGKRNSPPVALTAHLDKINHWGEIYPKELPTAVVGERIRGVMDDTVGLGICLQMLLQSEQHNFPPLYILFSEMEESTDLKKRPHLLKNNGKNMYAGIGAQRISKYLLMNSKLPAAIITIDTTPEFKEKPGICFYDKFWHRDKNFIPTPNLLSKIEKMKNFFVKEHPSIVISNANNDYLEYGLVFNENKQNEIPSVALEPAIFPYHEEYEGVHCQDIAKIEALLISFLENFNLNFDVL